LAAQGSRPTPQLPRPDREQYDERGSLRAQRRCPGPDRAGVEAARTGALTVFGLMVGTLQLARALTDRDLSDQLLARGVETALKLLDDRA
jgi:hypothetical protein